MSLFDIYMTEALGQLTEATSYPDIMAVGRPGLMDKYNKNVNKSHDLFINPTPKVLEQLAYRVYKGTEEFHDRFSETKEENKDVVVTGEVRGVIFKNKLYCMNANYGHLHWDILDKMIEENILTAKDLQTIGIQSIERFKQDRADNIQISMKGYEPFADLFLCVIQDETSNTFLMGESYSMKFYNSEKLKSILATVHIPPYKFKATKW